MLILTEITATTLNYNTIPYYSLYKQRCLSFGVAQNRQQNTMCVRVQSRDSTQIYYHRLFPYGTLQNWKLWQETMSSEHCVLRTFALSHWLQLQSVLSQESRHSKDMLYLAPVACVTWWIISEVRLGRAMPQTEWICWREPTCSSN